MERREVLKKTALSMGFVLSGTTLTALLDGCTPDNPSLSWKPNFFKTNQALTVGSLVESLIPETDTPGANSLHIDRFIDTMIAYGYSEKDKSKFSEELDGFLNDCEKKYGQSFENCNIDEKKNCIENLESKSVSFPDQVWGKLIVEPVEVNFYRKLKAMALLGYCTSEKIGKTIFTYDPIPGKQIGCIDLKDVGNAWTEG